MPTHRVVPSVAAILQRQDERIRRLEAKLSQVIDSRHLPNFFSFSGLVDEAVESPPMRFIHTTQINLLVPQVLVAPAGGDLTIDLTLYGPTTGVVRTLTIPDGSFYVEDAVPFIVPAGGSLTATVTAANGAEDLAIAADPILL